MLAVLPKNLATWLVSRKCGRFDPFSLNQHGTGVVETSELESAFGDRIKEIGATLIVASPWNNPGFLARAWCLFELMTSVKVGVEPTIMLPERQERAFLDSLVENWRVVFKGGTVRRSPVVYVSLE